MFTRIQRWFRRRLMLTNTARVLGMLESVRAHPERYSREEIAALEQLAKRQRRNMDEYK